MATQQDLNKIMPDPQQQARIGPRIGHSGLRIWAGYLSEEYLPELRGHRAYVVYDEMRKGEPIIQAILNSINSIIMAAGYTIEPATQEDRDLQAAQHVSQAFERLKRPITDVYAELLTMFPYGYAPMEIIYSYEAGKIWWHDIALRGQESIEKWEINEYGDILGLWQRTQHNGALVFIPWEKMLLFRITAERNNPEGLSILRAAYKPYFYKRVLEEIEAMGAERDLLGIPVMRVPYGATPDEIEAARRIVESVKNDDQAGIVETAIGPNPEDRFEFRLLTGQGSSGRVAFTDRLIQRYSSEMALACLAQFLRLGVSGGGSYSLSSDQRDTFQLAIRGWLKRIEDVWNSYAIPRLLAFNGLKGSCRLKHGRVAQYNLQTLANYITAGAQNKWLTPNRQLEQWLRDVAELPRLDDQQPALSDNLAAPQQLPDNSGINSNPGVNQNSGGLSPTQVGADARLQTEWEHIKHQTQRKLAELYGD